MDKKKLWLVIPIVSAIALALVLGSLVFSAGRAARTPLSIFYQEDESGEQIPGNGGFEYFGRGRRFARSLSFDYDAFIANELGVTVTELQAARQAAEEAALTQAVSEGLITQDQADLMQARLAFREYIDPRVITSKALGITPEELEAALQAGKPVPYLQGELGLEPGDFQTALQTAYEEALQQAVNDGILTESQAEKLQKTGFLGHGLGMQGHRSRFPQPRFP